MLESYGGNKLQIHIKKNKVHGLYLEYICTETRPVTTPCTQHAPVSHAIYKIYYTVLRGKVCYIQRHTQMKNKTAATKKKRARFNYAGTLSKVTDELDVQL